MKLLNVSFGQDDIVDPWNPLGTGNLRDVVLNGLYVTQMMGHQQILDSYRFITHNAARTLNLSNYGIEVGNPASFVIFDAASWYEALSFNAPVVASYREGRLIARTAPLEHEVLF